jgi:hypothetical protein
MTYKTNAFACKKKEKSFQEFKSLDKWLELQFLLDAVKVSFISLTFNVFNVGRAEARERGSRC